MATRYTTTARSQCPLFCQLTHLPQDPSFQTYVEDIARQVLFDLTLDSEDPRADICTCPDRKIGSQNAVGHMLGGLGALIQPRNSSTQEISAEQIVVALVNAVTRHLHPSIEAAVHDVLSVPLDWQSHAAEFEEHIELLDREHVVVAAAWAIQERLDLEKDRLHRLTIMGALLNIVEAQLQDNCENFQHKDFNRVSHRWKHDELVMEAFEQYFDCPSRETFELASTNLRDILRFRPCPCPCSLHEGFPLANPHASAGRPVFGSCPAREPSYCSSCPGV